MPRPVCITYDSTCDLTPQLLERFQIRTAPDHPERGAGLPRRWTLYLGGAVRRLPPERHAAQNRSRQSGGIQGLFCAYFGGGL